MKLVEKIYEDLATAMAGYSNVTPDIFGVAIHGHITNGVYMHLFSDHKRLAEELAAEAAELMSAAFPSSPVSKEDVMDGIIGKDYWSPSIHIIDQAYVSSDEHVGSGTWMLVELSVTGVRGWVHQDNYAEFMETGDLDLTARSIPAW